MNADIGRLENAQPEITDPRLTVFIQLEKSEPLSGRSREDLGRW
jgi:hypothetical protein